MPIAVGINLGSTRSAVAIYLNEEITMIPQDNGKNFMPSVVAFTSDGILVGDPAEEQSIVNLKNTISGIKRIIGRRFDDPHLKKFVESVSYDVENVGGNPKISVTCKGDKRLYDPESISAMILKKLKVRAEIILGHKITNAVLTVPAFFNDSQRQATKDAGSLAGLNILQILNEPTAAAIAYGLDKSLEKEKDVLIYDFGSGMFDVSILKIKDGNSFQTQATMGDTNLGGFEIDSILVEYCSDLFSKEHKKDVKSDFRALRRLRVACSHAKDILSSEKETLIILDALIDGIDFHITISRSKFEELCEEIFNRTIELLHQVVVDSGINKKDIDDVVLIGGSSEIPKIRQLVSNYFDGKHITQSLNPSQAVVYGAAVRAAFLSGYKDRKIKNMFCIDVTPLSIGIETSGGIMTIVIERNTPIPIKTSYIITTHTENQAGVAIRVFEGERALTCNNHLLGTLELLGLPSLPRGVPRVKVTFEIDSNGILTVSAEERSGMKFDAISINLHKGRLSNDDINRILEEADEFQEEDQIEKDRNKYRKSLENYIHTISKAAFTNAGNRLNTRDKLEINRICNELRDWLETNLLADTQAIIQKRNSAIKLLQPYASCLDLSVVARDDAQFSKELNGPKKQSLCVEKYET